MMWPLVLYAQVELCMPYDGKGWGRCARRPFGAPRNGVCACVRCGSWELGAKFRMCSILWSLCMAGSVSIVHDRRKIPRLRNFAPNNRQPPGPDPVAGGNKAFTCTAAGSMEYHLLCKYGTSSGEIPAQMQFLVFSAPTSAPKNSAKSMVKT